MPKRKRSATPYLPPTAPPEGPPVVGVCYLDREVARFLRLKNHRTIAVWRHRGSHPTLKYHRDRNTKRVWYMGEDILDYLRGTATAEPERRRKA
jgi:hypothetical protein